MNTKEVQAAIKAGKPLQVQCMGGEWIDGQPCDPLAIDPKYLRIKPESQKPRRGDHYSEGTNNYTYNGRTWALRTPRADILRALAYMADNIGQPACLETKSGFENAKRILREEQNTPAENVCCVCGTTEDLHKDWWYGYRCGSPDCACF